MRFWLAVALAGGLLGAAACDDNDTASSKGPSGLSAPAPVHFAKSGPPPADAGALQLAYLSARSAPGSGPAEPSADRWGRMFDGLSSARGLSEPTPTTSPAAGVRVVRAGMKIDTDGWIASRAAYQAVAARDRTRQNDTKLHYADGRPLDPTKVPYVVIPPGSPFRQGDCVVVSYRGRSTAAIVGDKGPRYGEASSALAASLGINPDGGVGGVERGVTYAFLPGSCSPPANEASLLAFLRQHGPALIARAGGGTTTLASSH